MDRGSAVAPKNAKAAERPQALEARGLRDNQES